MKIQDQIDGGWRFWLVSPPPHGVLIQITGEDADWEFVTTRDDIPPEANACGLYWRLTGIGKMQMEFGIAYWNFPSDYILPRERRP